MEKSKYLSRKFLIALTTILTTAYTELNAYTEGDKLICTISMICKVLATVLYIIAEARIDQEGVKNVEKESNEEGERQESIYTNGEQY